jgi:hypothetical protein
MSDIRKTLPPKTAVPYKLEKIRNKIIVMNV